MTIKVTYNVTDVYMSQSISPVYINVSYSDGGASGGGVWGSITGTLSNQTDLQSALDLKVPYSGATGNVNLGEYELKAGQVTLDTSPTGTAAVGTTRWNDTIGSSETTLKGGSVILKNGVDLVARVVNKVTPNTTLTKASYQAVRVSGAQGQRLAVELAQANNDINSADTIGLVIETIATNQEGFIMTVGQLENINTTGSLQGETWNDGDVLYLSPTTAGAITNVQPTGSGHIVVIGYVEYAHANNGKIYVKILNGWELTELHDTEIVSPANNEALIYESSSALWKNKTIATALGYTPANAATTLTINGVTYDLSTSRTWTIAAGISGSGTAGQVTYWSGSSAVSGSNNLFWDNTNGRLGIGTNAPANALHIATNSATAAPIQLRNTNSQGFATFYLSKFDGSDAAGFGYVNAANTTAALANRFVFYTFNNTPISFTRNSDFTPNLFIAGASGNIGINTDAPTVRLDVRGDTLLRGSGATSATTALTVQNSSSTNLFTVRNDGNVGIGTITPISKIETFNTSIYVAGAFSMYSNTASDEAIFYFRRGRGNLASPLIVQSGDVLGSLRFAVQFNSTVGGYNTNSKIDSVAESNGADLRFYTNNAGYSLSPTERMRIKSNGQVRFVPLASAPSGAESGDVYYNSTDNKHYGYNGTTWNAFY